MDVAGVMAHHQYNIFLFLYNNKLISILSNIRDIIQINDPTNSPAFGTYVSCPGVGRIVGLLNLARSSSYELGLMNHSYRCAQDDKIYALVLVRKDSDHFIFELP